ncbi:IclR family transcriptional regulator [Natrialba swarupiae]|uniref:IclR family transcriptional regulator n=1 Tax=Natrialba swarupiae TaxID=2448032 RepID=A0A5D5AL46_9EURY|nr:IclR family transcriptional regulator [Natrialba swarupiae]TYT61665.1 IclR family transcriptional regulator [Natrialba swarupiae]
MEDGVKSVAKTTETSIEVVNALEKLGEATLEELADQLDLSPSTTHRHLATLRKHKFVTQTDNQYRLGLQFLTVGGVAQRRVTAFPTIKEKVDELAKKTGERAQFIVEEHGERIYLYTEVGQSAVQTGAHVGKRGELYTSAGGKAILAHLPDDRRTEIVDDLAFETETSASIGSVEELSDELETIRERGYAFNVEETTRGVNAVGAVVTDADQRVLGALSVSGPANRLKGDRLTEEFPAYVLGAINELELEIAHAVRG